MNKRLGDLKIGQLKTSSIKRTAAVEPVQIHVPVISAPTLDLSIPELNILANIPGIGPYLTPDNKPDLIYLLQYHGINVLLSQFPKEGSTPPEEYLKIFKTFDLLQFVDVVRGIVNSTTQDLLTTIYRLGIPEMERTIAKADPNNPKSFIFMDITQDGNRALEEVEIQLWTSEPELIESDAFECIDMKCRQRRIRYIDKQTRSADEPLTRFFECVTCKKKWREG